MGPGARIMKHQQIHRTTRVFYTFVLALALLCPLPLPDAAQAAMSGRCERLLLNTAASAARCRLRGMARATRSGSEDQAACDTKLQKLLDRVAEKTGGECPSPSDRNNVDGHTHDAVSKILNGIRGHHRPIGCEQVRCPVGSSCEIQTLEFPVCADSCADTECPVGTSCRLVPAICPALFGFPCPDIAECVPTEGCDPACERGQECRLHEESGLRYCADTCAICGPDETCQVLDTPCPGPERPCPPVVICEEKPENPCALIDCSVNQICRVDPNTREGYCADTCEGVRCEDGETCVLVDVTCVTSPCPPVAACRQLETCSLPPEVGPCDAAFVRYVFNPRSDRCERFLWGGCGGNDNNFESLESCKQACGRDIDH